MSWAEELLPECKAWQHELITQELERRDRRIAELDKEYRAAMENLNERDAVIDQQQAELERLRALLEKGER